jgi:hypothetical protein
MKCKMINCQKDFPEKLNDIIVFELKKKVEHNDLFIQCPYCKTIFLITEDMYPLEFELP